MSYPINAKRQTSILFLGKVNGLTLPGTKLPIFCTRGRALHIRPLRPVALKINLKLTVVVIDEPGSFWSLSLLKAAQDFITIFVCFTRQLPWHEMCIQLCLRYQEVKLSLLSLHLNKTKRTGISGQWGKTRTKIIDGIETQEGSFPCSMAIQI